MASRLLGARFGAEEGEVMSIRSSLYVLSLCDLSGIMYIHSPLNVQDSGVQSRQYVQFGGGHFSRRLGCPATCLFRKVLSAAVGIAHR